ncbi:unnamed protein product [Parnassius apollo]|uniref:(apollo) hypothetical protein n=1 Tax=Parnassius apollo TaxID=110799 RepID=A0A8S3WNN4_PARAO|nr:unnamed protein product [Parnassius apollo]
MEKENRKKREVRFWIHPILEKREEYGAFHTLVKNQLREDEDKFYNYFRMQKTTFDNLLQKLSQELKHQDTFMRESISPAERLAVTLRYLATGDTFTDLYYSYRIGIKTISCIVREVCHYICVYKRSRIRAYVRHRRHTPIDCHTTLVKITPCVDAARRGAVTAHAAAAPCLGATVHVDKLI